MQKVFYLASCSTCQRIIKTLQLDTKFDLHDIKANKISVEDLAEMKNLAGSYEALFSRRSMKFRPMGLHLKQLSEEDYKNLILEEYTFLKRPVVVDGNFISVGNAPKDIDKLAKHLGK